MWADFVAWLGTPSGSRIFQGAIVPALAILIAGIVAALIGRAAARSVLTAADRERATTAVAGLVEAARSGVRGGRTGADGRRLERLRSESDVRVRMLTLPGADQAATWAAEQTDIALAQSGSSATEADATVARMRDRLVTWTVHPRRAKKLFAPELPLAAPGPRRTAVSEPAPPAAPAAAAEPDRPAVAEPTEVPQAGAAPVGDESTSPEEVQTAPVLVQHTRRTFGPSGTDTTSKPDTRAARHAQPIVVPAPETAPAAPAAAVATTSEEPPAAEAPKPTTPAWLDTYDDDAQVTQNMNLKTPPPVAAAAVRDRAPANADIVPR